MPLRAEPEDVAADQADTVIGGKTVIERIDERRRITSQRPSIVLLGEYVVEGGCALPAMDFRAQIGRPSRSVGAPVDIELV